MHASSVPSPRLLLLLLLLLLRFGLQLLVHVPLQEPPVGVVLQQVEDALVRRVEGGDVRGDNGEVLVAHRIFT